MKDQPQRNDLRNFIDVEYKNTTECDREAPSITLHRHFDGGFPGVQLASLTGPARATPFG